MKTAVIRLVATFVLTSAVAGSAALADVLAAGAASDSTAPKSKSKSESESRSGTIVFLRLGIGSGTSAISATNNVRLIDARMTSGLLKAQAMTRRPGWLESEVVGFDGTVLSTRWDPDPSLERYEYGVPSDNAGNPGGLAWTASNPSPSAEKEYQCMIRIPWDAKATALRVYRSSIRGGGSGGDHDHNRGCQQPQTVSSPAAIPSVAFAAAGEASAPGVSRVLVGSVSLTNILNQATQR